ncbi:MAG: TRAP transporter small permease [Pleomorphochaeta sp.]|jgi:TRAP-type C4-dicarboxylate transport system permease small subunit
MNKVLKIIDKIISFILSSLVAILAIGIILTVFLRYIFGISFNFFEEFLTNCFAAIIFIGSALAIREKQHIQISYFKDSFTPKRQEIVEIIIMSIIIIISAFIINYSIKWISMVGSTVSPASGIPMGIFYLMVPISFILTIFYCAIDILGHFIKIDPAISGYFDDADLPEEN